MTLEVGDYILAPDIAVRCCHRGDIRVVLMPPRLLLGRTKEYQ